MNHTVARSIGMALLLSLAATAAPALRPPGGCTPTFFTICPTPHLPFPQMPGHGQPPLSRLQLVTVTFGDYPFRDFVESFGDFVVTSQWLAAVTQDFGPITATHLQPVNLPASAFDPTACDPNSTSLESVVLDNIKSGALPYPADPTGLLYLFCFPRHRKHCTNGGGYHGWTYYNSRPVAYAAAQNWSDGESAVGVASHEIAEALMHRRRHRIKMTLERPMWHETAADGGGAHGEAAARAGAPRGAGN